MYLTDDKKYLLIVDSILIVGSLLSIFFMVGYTQPLAVGPLEDSQSSLMFNFFDADYLILDDNLRFDSPETIFIDEQFNLEPGKYYIKILYGLSSEVREINSEVKLSLELRRLSDGSTGVFNVGESNLEVQTYVVGSLVNSSLINGGNG